MGFTVQEKANITGEFKKWSLPMTANLFLLRSLCYFLIKQCSSTWRVQAERERAMQSILLRKVEVEDVMPIEVKLFKLCKNFGRSIKVGKDAKISSKDPSSN